MKKYGHFSSKKVHISKRNITLFSVLPGFSVHLYSSIIFHPSRIVLFHRQVPCTPVVTLVKLKLDYEQDMSFVFKFNAINGG